MCLMINDVICGDTVGTRYYAGWTDKITGDTLPAAAQGFLTYTRKVRERHTPPMYPLGVR